MERFKVSHQGGRVRGRSKQYGTCGMVKKCFRWCDGNSGFFHDLFFVEVSERDNIVWFIIFSVCKRFGS